MQETIKDMVEFFDQYKSWRQDQVNEDGDPINYRDFDEGRADFGEEALDLVERLVAVRPEGIDLVFGDGTDGDTFQTIFEVLTRYDGYIVGVNGVDIQVKSLQGATDQVGFTGKVYDNDLGEVTDQFVSFDWEDIQQVWIY